MDNKAVTIVYSWDNEDHVKWVKKLAMELEKHNIQVTYDQNSLELGDDVNQFMELAVDTASIILAICTEKYKMKIDNREGGSGYEGRMIAQIMRNHSAKIISITKDGYSDDKIPRALQGIYSLNLEEDLDKQGFANLLQVILGYKVVKSKEKLDPRKTIAEALDVDIDDVKTDEELALSDIKILNIISEDVTLPKMDGSRGSALYNIPFKMSEIPTDRWNQYFIHFWNNPSKYSSMHRSKIASIERDVIWLNGTTIEEVKNYHRDTLILAVNEANNAYNKEIVENEENRIRDIDKRNKLKKHINDEIRDITF
ncbi:toll/interleukin-1 receptor domain-containing protein [Enterococcus devriesei]|uniref:SEFIR domain-containing protein n=1 Tax=Enterococcus devriesei TaxID=319970 RepID=A0A1L8ST60_9ENTE|nr:toll/interleukin-1 receptor domain-containing protein [Enterococcus devriesei]OJG35024.1 hypothetical protein RV00_GL000574 [Enterococcus devriesei]